MTTLIHVVLIYIAGSIVFVVALGALGWWLNRMRDRSSERF